jgi:ribosomal protein S18 acetylase RimI-like enzyme
VVDELVGRAVAFANDVDARLVQTLLPADCDAIAYRLREARFQHSAELYFLVSPPAAFPTEMPATELEFEAVGEEGRGARGEGREASENWRRLAAMVERTYVETLDCPQLNGVRPVAEILEGYRAVGQFDPRRWLIVRHAGGDVGCLLLAEHPGRIWELVYMGLAPEARGKRWGLEITRHAQWLAGQGGAEHLVLAVDAENAPAIRAYTAAGLIAWERRSAWLKIL